MSKTQELIKKLQDGVRDVFESGRFQEYLDFLSSFRHYSFGNCLLLWQQMPSCSLVASYTDWNQKHHRQVKKGSKALKVLAPHYYKEKDADGVERDRLGFHCASCFDISQTYSIDDTPLPSLSQSLDADVVGSADIIETLMNTSPCPIDIVDIEGSARGFFSPSDLLIVVQRDMSPADTIKTILHEQAHAWIFSEAQAEEYTRAEHEVSAESIAYILCQRLGIDSGDYSFGYVSGWSADRTTPELMKSLDLIRKVSENMWSLIEDKLVQDGLTSVA